MTMNFFAFLYELLLINIICSIVNGSGVTFRDDIVKIIGSKTEDFSGDWTEWKYCNSGEYGGGFNLKIEDPNKDDTSVNAFSLACYKSTFDDPNWKNKKGGNNGFNDDNIDDPNSKNNKGGSNRRRRMQRMKSRLLLGNDDVSVVTSDIVDNMNKELEKKVGNNVGRSNVIFGNFEGKFGHWKSIKVCNNGKEYLRGFKTKVKEYKKKNDNTALNSVTGYCTNTNKEITINRNGEGNWAENPAMCPKHSIVCGFRQKIRPFRGAKKDDWSLTEIELACCNAPMHFIESEGYWVRRIGGNADASFSYDSNVGITNYASSQWSEEHSNSLTSTLSATIGMKFSFFDIGINEQITASLSNTAVNKIIEQSIESVTRTINEKFTMKCDSGVALYQYVNSIDFKSYNLDDSELDIETYDYICSQSGQAPKCPYEYCSDLSENSNDPDCQICKENLFV